MSRVVYNALLFDEDRDSSDFEGDIAEFKMTLHTFKI